MQLTVEFLGLMRVKLACTSLTLDPEDPQRSAQISVEKLLRQLEKLFSEKHLRLIEDGKLRKEVMVMRKNLASGKMIRLTEYKNQWMGEGEALVLTSLVAGG
jgi:hypothetical protein